MTAEGKQCLLRYLGYAPGPVDGIWGQSSQSALARFQKAEGLPEGADGIFCATRTTRQTS